MLRLAFHSGFLTDYPVLEAVRMIRDHGYDAVELNAETLPWAQPHIGPDTPARTISELAKLGPYSSICAHHADFGVANRDRAKAAEDWTCRLMDIALDLDIGLLHVIAAEQADLDALYESLDRCVEAAEAKGLTLALEPIVGRAIADTATASRVLARIPDLKLNFDPSHLHLMGDDVVMAAQKLAADIRHVHLKDAVGNVRDFAFVPLGTGEIDLDGMMHELITAGYDGVVSVEHESHIFANDQRSVPEVLDSAKAFFDNLMKNQPPSKPEH